MAHLPSFLAALVLVGAAVADLRWRRIPNALVIALLGIAALRLTLDFNPLRAGYDAAGALATLLLLSFAWWRNVLGGGDVKLAAAAALLVGYRALPGFLVLTAVTGGVLALLVLADAWADRSYSRSVGIAFPTTPSARPNLTERQPSVPYGVAISLACLLTIFFSSPA